MAHPAQRSGLLALVSFIGVGAGSPVRAADVTVTIDPNADRRAVSPLIYGANFGSPAQANRLRWPVRRWGGNSVTRYSWEFDTHNTASDWFFFNIVDGSSTELPNGSTDIHYYPQASGVTLSDDESAATSALRLRSLKGLYDPAYVDESWIGGAGWEGGIVKLIPRMKAWIAARYPGTKLAITEYSWGNDDGVSSTLAQAEALAIFGREGVDLATRWGAPADNSRVEDAFLLYLNYNGAGGKVVGDTVRATTSNVDQVGSYAIRNGNTLYVLLFNKHTAARSASVAVVGGLTQTAALYGFDGANRLRATGSATPAGGALNLTLAARSATLAVVTLGTPTPPGPTRFYTLSPCRVLDTRSPGGGPALAASGERMVTLAGVCAVPQSAKAVSANLTVTQPTTAGNLVLFPTGTTPGTSTINYLGGQTRGNNAVVSLNAAAAVSIRCNQASGSAHVILDVNGYFQ